MTITYFKLSNILKDTFPSSLQFRAFRAERRLQTITFQPDYEIIKYSLSLNTDVKLMSAHTDNYYSKFKPIY